MYFKSVLLLLLPLLTHGEEQLRSYDTIYHWKELDFAFNSSETREQLIASGQFIPKNNVITGIKVSGDRMFLTVPRWRNGVPATLVSLPYNPDMKNPVEKKLVPYPSWAMNELGNCSAIQYVQSMEIDPYGRMWVVDVGRVNIFLDNPDNTCPPKLVLMDLKTDTVLRSHNFSADVVGGDSSFLNDIVVGCKSESDCWAFISDARDAKIVVYNYEKDKSWYVQHESMKADPNATEIIINGQAYEFDTATDGIALSPLENDFKTLYYCPLSSYSLYSLDVAALKAKLLKQKSARLALTDAEVTDLGLRPSQADGMVIDAKGNLYYGQLANNSVGMWNTQETGLTGENQLVILANDEDLQWVDTFAIDERTDGFITTNRLHRYTTDTYNTSDINFRVIRFKVGQRSYQYLPSAGLRVYPTAAVGFASLMSLFSRWM